MGDGNLRDAANGVGSEAPSDAKPPFVFTFELTGPAAITGFQAGLRAAPDNGPPPNVRFAVSTTGPDSGFADVGSIAGTNTSLAASTKARWVRVTANELFDSVGATGTIAPPPSALNPAGIFMERIDPDKNGAFVTAGRPDNFRAVRFVKVGSSLIGTECTDAEVIGTFIGTLQGRQWRATFAGNGNANPDNANGIINDDGSIIAGTNASGGSKYFTRTTETPTGCSPRSFGTGVHRVLVLDQDPVTPFYPANAATPLPGYRFDSIGAGMLESSTLAGKETVVLRNTCRIPDLMAPEQIAMLLQWLAAGHKLVIAGNTCEVGRADFSWVTYPFTTPGSGPETTHAGLIQIENSALGTNDKNDAANFVDVNVYATDANNGLANAGVVTTTDPHWCGHFFVAKPTNINGFVQMYAHAGSGLIVYDGFDDDGDPALVKLRQLEMALPVSAGLPCTQHVTEKFLLEPNQEVSFAAGTAQTLNVPMELLANQGWSGNVSLKASGDLPVTVTPNTFNLAGGTLAISAGINVTAATKPGLYTDIVTADNGAGTSAQASVTLTGTGSIKKQFTPKQKRIRIYGIHFDVDSAVIQPRSEPVIADIAQVLRADSSLRFQVEGHTDSDGGAAYNLGLSQRRAQAVVDDLVKRYGIARNRLVPKGFGLTVPVATNATAAGKALNRRVELLRL